MKIGGEVRGDLNLLVHQIVHEGDAVGIEERQTTDDHRKQRHSQRPDLSINLPKNHHIGRVRVVGLIAAALRRVEVDRASGIPHQTRVGTREKVQWTRRLGKRAIVGVQRVENVSDTEIDDVKSRNAIKGKGGYLAMVVLGDQDVLRLDVTMHHFVLMDCA